MIVIYSALVAPLVMTAVVLGPNVVGGNHDNEKTRYSPLVRHAAVPPPIYDLELVEIEHPLPPPTPTPRPPQPAPQPTRQIPAPQPLTTAPVAQGGIPEDVLRAIYTHFPDHVVKASRMTFCESTWQPATNTGNGYYGMWQFDLDTWYSVGGQGLPSNASADEQTYRARLLYEQRGWQPWGCQ